MLDKIPNDIVLNILMPYLYPVDFSNLLCINKCFNNTYKLHFTYYIDQSTNIINSNVRILHTLKIHHNCSDVDYKLLNIFSIKNIYNIDFSWCCYLKDLYLLNMINIINCNLRECYILKDLYGLTGNIINLNIRGCCQVTDLSPLSNLKNLVKLNLRGCYKITDLSALSNLKNLSNLNLRGCVFIDKFLPGLYNITNLVKLNLRGCWQIVDYIMPLSLLFANILLNSI